MISSITALLFLALSFALGFIGVRTRNFMLVLPAVVLLGWFVFTTEIRLVSVEGGEREQEMYLALPWGEATYTYQGELHDIPTTEDVAVVNMTTDHDVELYRHGVDWLFGLIHVSREHVVLAPGQVGAISGTIKGKNKAHATYFTLTVHPVSDGDGNGGE